MSLSLVRVDDRLIHGQVVLMWAKVREGDAIILLVDDALGNDEFMKEVFKNAGNSVGKKVHIFTVAQAIEKVPQAIASKKRYYLISKTIMQLYELRKHGVDFGTELIFGTASKKPKTVKVFNNIYVSKEAVEACTYLEEQGVHITFKLIPDETGLSWKTVHENLKKEDIT